jgi:hypothetical protein
MINICYIKDGYISSKRVNAELSGSRFTFNGLFFCDIYCYINQNSVYVRQSLNNHIAFANNSKLASFGEQNG